MGLDEETKKLCLEHMCPEPLQDHPLEKFEQGMISTYDQYKQVVSTYVDRKAKKNRGFAHEIGDSLTDMVVKIGTAIVQWTNGQYLAGRRAKAGIRSLPRTLRTLKGWRRQFP